MFTGCSVYNTIVLKKMIDNVCAHCQSFFSFIFETPSQNSKNGNIQTTSAFAKNSFDSVTDFLLFHSTCFLCVLFFRGIRRNSRFAFTYSQFSIYCMLFSAMSLHFHVFFHPYDCCSNKWSRKPKKFIRKAKFSTYVTTNVCQKFVFFLQFLF